MNWSYGITTVPSRKTNLLPKVIESLKTAGFDCPRLFVDGCSPSLAQLYVNEFKLQITPRFPTVNVYSNWYLSLCELYFRNPNADRFALFQDDIQVCKNLRNYIETTPYPNKGYFNLYTSGSNHTLKPNDLVGWFPSNQLGRGALALVFNREATTLLLSSSHMIAKVQDGHRGWRAADGAVSDTLRPLGWTEFVHHPSLVQHIGEESTIGNLPDRRSPSFAGEQFDPLQHQGTHQ